MNIRRGLLRLWLVAAIGWCAYWTLRLWSEYSRFEVPPTLLDVLPVAGLIVAIPLVVLAIGSSIYWALAGFHAK